MKDKNEKEENNEIIDVVPNEISVRDEKKHKNEEKAKEDFDSPNPSDEDIQQTEKKTFREKLSSRLGKAIIITALILVLIIIVIFIILHLSSSVGIRTAEKISKYLGETPKTCETKLDISLKTQSAYDVINKGVDFNRIYEDKEKTVKCNGITFPTWAVFVTTGNEDNISSVRYTDFSVIKDNLLGSKKNAPISLKRFDKGTGKGTIEDEIGLEPYSVTFKVNGTKYVYKYWYKNDSGDNQGVILSVNFDNDNKFVDCNSKMIYPPNL